MAMFGGKRLPAPNAQDLADFNEVLRRAGQMPDGAVFNDHPTYDSGPTSPPQPPAAAPMTPPQGMFGNPGPSVANAQPLAPQMPGGLDTGVGTIKPHFFDKTGLGSKIANGLGAFSTTMLALRGNQGAQGMLADEAKGRQNEALLNRQMQSQQNQLARQIAFEQFKLQNPADPAILRTADSLFPRGSAQWQQFVKTASLTPHLIGIPNMAGGTDYMDPTGMSGPGGGGAPVSKVINGQTYYNINGEWYDNPEGK